MCQTREFYYRLYFQTRIILNVRRVTASATNWIIIMGNEIMVRKEIARSMSV